ncbi:DUF1801 domain-containing protein [Georgenia sp. SYP-B2076]|uniref:DUF1801 domain-containing protein n=1 Tax=Georgenia sp. SYP-B2076 TaxID=2495881 RepID=UPI000F8D01D2|nr:DUF1801 domain-containing protein [Georgenia sp. SYP-B2076]
MTQNLTRPTDGDVAAFIARAEPAGRREDAAVLLGLMTRVTGEGPVLWGTSMVGFGQYRYRYESGREGDSLVVGFSPRKASMSLYGLQHHDVAPLLARLDPHKLGVSCLYVGRFGRLDLDVLEQLVDAGWRRGGLAGRV